MMHKLLAVAAVLVGLVGINTASAQNARVDIGPGDVSLANIELVPGEPAKLVIYFSNAKLLEFRKAILANFGKPVAIYAGGTLVAEPVIESELLNKRRRITLRFPSLEGAAAAAGRLIPQG